MGARDAAEVPVAVGFNHLVRRHVGQLHLGVAVRERVKGVVVAHAALTGIPLQDHLLEGLQGEDLAGPALADGIADGL